VDKSARLTADKSSMDLDSLQIAVFNEDSSMIGVILCYIFFGAILIIYGAQV